MKLLSFLVFFVASITLCFSADVAKNPQLQATGETPSQVDPLTPDQARRANALAEWTPQDARRGSKNGETQVCYKIRSYHVIRDSRNSDVTRPDGYSTCQPASQFEVKKTIDPGGSTPR